MPRSENEKIRLTAKNNNLMGTFQEAFKRADKIRQQEDKLNREVNQETHSLKSRYDLRLVAAWEFKEIS